MDINKLKIRLKENIVTIMDGAVGTEILRHGYETNLPLWSAEVLLTNPQVVKKIHKEYIDAGAEIIITNTFRTTERSLAKKNIYGRARELTQLACTMVKQAIEEAKPGHEVFIAGSVAPLEDCYSPELTPSDKELEEEHLAYVKDLKNGGVDFILVETMITFREVNFVLKASQKLSMPVAVSFCVNDQLELLSGEKLSEVMPEVEKYNPLFIGINCVSRTIADRGVKYLRSLTKLPICVYPHEEEKNLDLYLDSARKWASDGATIIGGCCGTTPLYIQKLSEIFKI